MPLALAIVSFVFVEYLGIKMLGIGYFGKFVRVRSLASGVGALFQFKLLDAFQGLLDFFFVGPLEAFSEFVRLISFTFRLFGNMTAGEILVLMSAFLVPFVATVGVYGLELLVGPDTGADIRRPDAGVCRHRHDGPRPWGARGTSLSRISQGIHPHPDLPPTGEGTTGIVRGATGMEVIVLAMVIGTLGIAAAALGGIFAIYASRQD